MGEVCVDLERCLCIHAASQVVDTILQVLLYQRQIIQEPTHYLIARIDSPKAQLFKTSYDEVAATLRGLFRAQNSRLVHDFLLAIGNSPYTPKEIYRVPIVPCSPHYDSSGGCGDNCGTLTSRDQRRIFSSIVAGLGRLPEFKAPTAIDKAFLYVRTSSYEVVRSVEGLEEDQRFQMPNATMRPADKSPRETVIRIRTPCWSISNGSACASSDNVTNGECWSRFSKHFNRFT